MSATTIHQGSAHELSVALDASPYGESGRGGGHPARRHTSCNLSVVAGRLALLPPEPLELHGSFPVSGVDQRFSQPGRSRLRERAVRPGVLA
jgi:hypothetical protein